MNKKIFSVLVTGSLLATLIAFPAGDAAAKKKKKKPKPVVCAPYAPGDLGAEAETVVVTDADTAEAPLAHPISLDPDFDEGLVGDAPTRSSTYRWMAQHPLPVSTSLSSSRPTAITTSGPTSQTAERPRRPTASSH